MVAALALSFTTPDHQLGRSHINPANVAQRNNTFRLNLPAKTVDGAEIRSALQYRSGVVRSRIRVANAPSSLTGFFLYAAPDYASEIDIEIMNDRTGTVLLDDLRRWDARRTRRRAGWASIRRPRPTATRSRGAPARCASPSTA